MRSSSCDSCEIAWADLVAQADDDTAAHVAEAFAVVGLAPGSVLEPLDGSSGGDDELVLANVCLVAKGEAVPEGHEVLTETLCGQKASINNAGATLHLAVRRLPRREVIRPITAIAIVGAEHPHGGGGGSISGNGSGHGGGSSSGGRGSGSSGGGGEDARVPAGFEALDRTAHGERCQTSKLICISRQPPSPREPSSEAAPIAAVAVVRASRHSREPEVPAGWQLLDRSLSAGMGGGSARRLCVRRARPCGLVQTPFKASLLEAIEYSQRPAPASGSRGGGGSSVGRRNSCWGNGDRQTPSFQADWASSLPSALPHFCLPLGARLLGECPWPTAHEFALTDRLGARLYGCCLTVWEPLGGQSLALVQPLTAEQRLRASKPHVRRHEPPASRVSRASSGVDWTLQSTGAPLAQSGEAGEAAAEALRQAFAETHRVVLLDAPAVGAQDGASDGAAAVAQDAVAQDEEAEVIADAALAGLTRERGGGGGWDGEEEEEEETEEAPSLDARLDAAAEEVRQSFRTCVVVDGARLYAPKALCVLSHHPFLCSLRQWLCELYRHSLSRTHVPLEELVCSLLWECPLPRPTVTVKLTLGHEAILFTRAAEHLELPVAELRLSALLGSLPDDQLLILFSAACVEQKIILVSAYASQLTAAAEALLALLWPLLWLNVYIPLLPRHLIEILGSPVPYLLGLHAATYAEAEALGLVPEDACIARLDLGRVALQPRLTAQGGGGGGGGNGGGSSGESGGGAVGADAPPLPPLPNVGMLRPAIVSFQRATWEEADAAQADLAFPEREQGREATTCALGARARAQREVRLAFAGWWARLLSGYQEYLVTNLSPEAGASGAAAHVLDAEGLIDSRTPDGRPLIRRMLQAQGLVRLLEQRASFSTRNAELVLFDSLADQYRDEERRDERTDADGHFLPTLPGAIPARVYSVPPPPSEGVARSLAAAAAAAAAAGHPEDDASIPVPSEYGPYERWQPLLASRRHVPRPIPPLNFYEAPLPTAPPTAPPLRRSSPPSLLSRTSHRGPMRHVLNAARRVVGGRSNGTAQRNGTALNGGGSYPGGGLKEEYTSSRSEGSLSRGNSFTRSGQRSGQRPGQRPGQRSELTTGHSAPDSPLSRASSWGTRLGIGILRLSDSGKRTAAAAAAAAAATHRSRPVPLPPPPPPSPEVWARDRVGEVLAAALLCHALCITPAMAEPERAIGVAHSQLEALSRAGVVPPQCAYHALLRACSHCRLPECSRSLFRQLQQAGGRPDAQTLGWLSHALIECSWASPPAASTPAASPLAAADDTTDDSHLGAHRAFVPAAAPSAPAAPALPTAAPALIAASSRASGRMVHLSVDDRCDGCGARLGAAEAVRGWYARTQREGLDYGCECPTCAAPWMPELHVIVDPNTQPRGAGAAATTADGSAAGGDGAESVKESVTESAPSSPYAARSSALTCPLLSPARLLREIEALLDTPRDRRMLREAWASARHLFPSVFWSLCWHAGPTALLTPLLAHFELSLATLSVQALELVHHHRSMDGCTRTATQAAPTPSHSDSFTITAAPTPSHADADEGGGEGSDEGERMVGLVLRHDGHHDGHHDGRDGGREGGAPFDGHDAFASFIDGEEDEFGGWVRAGFFVVSERARTLGAGASPRT